MPKMTYQQFLAILRKTQGWRLKKGFHPKPHEYWILNRQGLCPLEAVGRKVGLRGSVIGGRLEGLPLAGTMQGKVQLAADDKGDPKIRRDLLKACRIKEKRS